MTDLSNDEFALIVKKLAAEQGVDVFNAAHFPALIADITKGEHKNDCRLLMQVIAEGVHREILTTDTLPETAAQYTRHMNENFFIENDAAQRMIEILCLAIRGEQPVMMPQSLVSPQPKQRQKTKTVKPPFVLKPGVTVIPDEAFFNAGLTDVIISEGVTTIGESAFAYNNLTHITLPKSLKVIGTEAFIGNKIEALEIPEGVTMIGESAFDSNCLRKITFPKSLHIIGECAFVGNKELESITIADADELVFEMYCFRHCSLKYVSITGENIFILESAFSGNEISTLFFEGVEAIEKYAFDGRYLNTITINENCNLDSLAICDSDDSPAKSAAFYTAYKKQASGLSGIGGTFIHKKQNGKDVWEAL